MVPVMTSCCSQVTVQGMDTLHRLKRRRLGFLLSFTTFFQLSFPVDQKQNLCLYSEGPQKSH
jgi:hypothetical protein